ncbi:Cobalt-zinc-cadmium resistance protein CzcA; Cation efflux system protein CusA [hydrothermal vent metagenome]|uniref:histidine kinase n=1 Tax=hydrothermal vent metagenome TaxID=652676 RepID=A0A3B0ZF87_9ZZZZ
MKFRTSLRYRITIAFALIGGIVSIALATALYWLTINMEERLIAETLSAELEVFITRYQRDSSLLPPSSTLMQIQVINAKDRDTEAAALRDLKAGLHQISFDHGSYYAEVRNIGEQQFVALYDDSQIRHREAEYQAFLVGGVLVMMLLSAALGLWLAGRVVSPVSELGRRVRGLQPAGDPRELSRDFPPDEVGFLASEFDAYQKRLRAFIEREQNFTADVSHELRTPLAVIEGAAEVLQEDAGLDEAQCTRVRRIARAAHEMTEITAALLELAREQRKDQISGNCDVAPLLEDIIEAHRHLLECREVSVELDIISRRQLPVQCALLRIVLANLVRNAFSYTRKGLVKITLDDTGITVMDTGEGILPEHRDEIFKPFYSAQGGEGIGLSLVRRICQNYGWEVSLDSKVKHGTCFRLDFSAD